MKYSVFTDTDWLYPDSPHSDDLLMQLACQEAATAAVRCWARFLPDLCALPFPGIRRRPVWKPDFTGCSL